MSSEPRINSKLLAAEHEGARVVQSTVLRKAEATHEVQQRDAQSPKRTHSDYEDC